MKKFLLISLPIIAAVLVYLFAYWAKTNYNYDMALWMPTIIGFIFGAVFGVVLIVIEK